MVDFMDKQAEYTLETYAALITGINNRKDRIMEWESEKKGIKSGRADGMPTRGGSCKRNDRIDELIINIDREKEELRRDERERERIERALAVLTKEQKTMLERFYINKERRAADRLAEELGIDIRTVYRRREEAKRLFRIAMYGRVRT